MCISLIVMLYERGSVIVDVSLSTAKRYTHKVVQQEELYTTSLRIHGYVYVIIAIKYLTSLHFLSCFTN